jgi:shikimate dehydrogenase
MSVKLGLIGHPVSHSLSPPMHRAAFSFFGITGSYELIDLSPQELPAGIDRLCRDNFSGFNVTIPHKQAVYALLKQHSPEASMLEAVNTVRIDSAGELEGHNTDLGGFINALALALADGDEVDRQAAQRQDSRFTAMAAPEFARGQKALLLGAGGAARACIAGLMLAGCRSIVLAARRPQQALTVSKSIYASVSACCPQSSCEFSIVSFEEIETRPAFTLVINCTPAGLNADSEHSFWFDSVIAAMESQALLFDSVYRTDRSPTVLMRMAARRGLKCVDGLSMLAEQAALSFEYWTGRRPSLQLLRDALSSH